MHVLQNGAQRKKSFIIIFVNFEQMDFLKSMSVKYFDIHVRRQSLTHGHLTYCVDGIYN